MRRVGLPQLSDEFAAVLPGARDLVAMRQHELLTRPDGSITAAA
jgi:hypothetical protein